MQQLTVTSLVRYLKNKLDTDNNLQRVIVAGEISNYHRHSSGHLYFTLKDNNAAINCVMFKSNASSLLFEPKNGDEVILSANTSIFETTGQLQLYVLKMNLNGLGELYQKYELLKKKLDAEGLFSDEHKISLTKEYIENVAVLIGDKSAALSDIKNAFKRRWPICNVDYYPVLVQGENAPSCIIDKLLQVDKMNYDAIILARGGGSFEDLFCFNDEQLVRTIYSLDTFIVTGIGHEQDFTLADFVSDLRGSTPTASVELITPNVQDVINTIDDYIDDLNSIMDSKIGNCKMKFDYYLQKLIHYQSHIDSINNTIDNKFSQIINLLKLKLENNKLTLKRYATLLDAYSINNTLSRGYTLVMQNGKVVKKRNELNNSEFVIKFIDGDINAIER